MREENYIKDSEIVKNSMWLSWIIYCDEYEQPIEEVIEVYKIRSIDSTFISHIDCGHVSIDYLNFLEDLEEGSGDPSSIILFSGFSNNISSNIKIDEIDDIHIDENVYKKILEIMYGGDCSILTDKDRVRDLRKYLRSFGFKAKNRVV